MERGQAPLSWALYLVQQVERRKMNSVDMPEGFTGQGQAGGGFLCIREVKRYSRVAWPSALDRNRTVVWARRIVTCPGRVRCLFNFLEEDWKPFCDLQVPNLTFYY